MDRKCKPTMHKSIGVKGKIRQTKRLVLKQYPENFIVNKQTILRLRFVIRFPF